MSSQLVRANRRDRTEERQGLRREPEKSARCGPAPTLLDTLPTKTAEVVKESEVNTWAGCIQQELLELAERISQLRLALEPVTVMEGPEQQDSEMDGDYAYSVSCPLSKCLAELYSIVCEQSRRVLDVRNRLRV